MQIREALESDRGGIEFLLPRLADFQVPAHRRRQDLWQGDRDKIFSILASEGPPGFVLVAEEDQTVAGLVFVSLGPETLSGQPSAHLEALAVAAGAEGRGIGGALIAAAEQRALQSGARTMTLTVFTDNSRARRIYERHGYKPELIRYIRRL